MCTKSGALGAKCFNQNAQFATHSSRLFDVPGQLILFGLVTWRLQYNLLFVFAEEPRLRNSFG
jgi:hypothetical protein